MTITSISPLATPWYCGAMTVCMSSTSWSMRLERISSDSLATNSASAQALQPMRTSWAPAGAAKKTASSSEPRIVIIRLLMCPPASECVYAGQCELPGLLRRSLNGCGSVALPGRKALRDAVEQNGRNDHDQATFKAQSHVKAMTAGEHSCAQTDRAHICRCNRPGQWH